MSKQYGPVELTRETTISGELDYDFDPQCGAAVLAFRFSSSKKFGIGHFFVTTVLDGNDALYNHQLESTDLSGEQYHRQRYNPPEMLGSGDKMNFAAPDLTDATYGLVVVWEKI